uniref:Zinc finger protein 106 n=1 Tax=Myotis myotis TaxID=51298 RepID=A0A7J8AT01_MYOMY|nr:zinc finger protein 106 [Myotis myotis]
MNLLNAHTRFPVAFRENRGAVDLKHLLMPRCCLLPSSQFFWSLHHPQESLAKYPHLLLSKPMAVFLLRTHRFRLNKNLCLLNKKERSVTAVQSMHPSLHRCPCQSQQKISMSPAEN